VYRRGFVSFAPQIQKQLLTIITNTTTRQEKFPFH
jgi:hypothetical protein